MARNILVAFDDSANAMRAVEFIAATFTPATRVTLLSVIPDTAHLCEMNSPELTAYFISQQSSFCVLEDKKRELVEQAQARAKQVLLEAGFDAANLRLRIEPKKRGVARDIVSEARADYDMVVLGRRGLSGIREFFLGSVSQKVLGGVKDASVLIVN